MEEGTQLGLLMGNVIGPAYMSVGQSVVVHEVDYTLDALSVYFRGADTMRGGALDVMFSRSAAVSSYGCTDVCRTRFFHTLLVCSCIGVGICIDLLIRLLSVR